MLRMTTLWMKVTSNRWRGNPPSSFKEEMSYEY
nr:MAG TPA: hypothetical protein [Caudoviricetes sp.]